MFVDALQIGLGIGFALSITIGPTWLFVMWVEHELARRRATWGKQR